MLPFFKKHIDSRWHKWFSLFILSMGFLLSVLGHYLIGATSRAMAKDLHFGDKACQYKNPADDQGDLEKPQCEEIKDKQKCEETQNCVWDYNGLGLAYHILAGPTYIGVYTTSSILCGLLADRFHRIWMIVVATFVFGLAFFTMGAATAYWHLVVLRMIIAVGEAFCNIVGTGILSDIFKGYDQALVLSIFNWGNYGGYGFAFPLGRYLTVANIWDLGWRLSYYIPGALTMIVAIVTILTLQEPERSLIGEEKQDKVEGKVVKNPWLVLIQPRLLLLCASSSVRQTGGIGFAYNCDLYYNTYFPGYDLGWPLFVVTVVVGSIGVIMGGFISDKLHSVMGVRGRLLTLTVSQLIATPFAFGSVYFRPLWAMITLGVSYLFAEMWIGIVFATLIDIVPLAVRTSCVGIFVFVMDNVGGNVPVLVHPVSKAIGYRESLYIFYVGTHLASSIMFFCTMFLMPGKRKLNPELQAGEVK